MSTAKPIPTLADPPNWWSAVATLRRERSHTLILSGSMVMLIGSIIVSGFNFGYNVALARLLGPAAFGHASAAVTLLMLVSAITLSFQLVCAKFVARNETVGARAAVYRRLMGRAWMVGLGLAAALVLGSGLLATTLRLPTPWIPILLAFGIAFYVPLGVKRGSLQGACAFAPLTSNLVLEAVVKFTAALLLVAVGYGVMGAVGAITVSVTLAYLLAPRSEAIHGIPEPGIPASFGEGMQAIVFFAGQVIINNVDILLVKHFFAPEDAGLYAAVSLVGRVLYVACWQVVSAMFPVSAGAQAEERSSNVLVVPLLLVLGIAVAFMLLVSFAPGVVMHYVFGAGFRQAASLLSLRTAATGCYALAAVLMAYEMSRRIANTGWLQMAFSGALIAGISMFHASLRQVVVVQVVLMVLMLMTVSLPFFRSRYAPQAAV